MNQENKGVKSNEVCKLCLHQECVCKEEWSGMHPLVSNLAIMEAVEHLYPPSFFTEQSLEEKCNNELEIDENGAYIYCLLNKGHKNECNPYLDFIPPTDSNWEEEFDSLYTDLDYPVCCTGRDCCCNAESYLINLKRYIQNLIQSERKEVIGKHNAHILNEWQLKGLGDERVLFPILEKATEISLSSNKPSNE